MRLAHQRRLLATGATAAALAASAPAAPAMPAVDPGGSARATSAPEPVRVRVVRVQVAERFDWSDAGTGAAGMIAIVLVGLGGAQALRALPSHSRTTASS